MKRKLNFFLAALLISPVIATAQTPEESKKLELTAKEFLDIYNTGDTSAYRIFLKKSTPAAALEGKLSGYRNTWNAIGKVSAVEMHAASPRDIEFLAKENKFGFWWKFSIETDSLQRFSDRKVLPVPLPEAGLQTGAIAKDEAVRQIDEYIKNTLGEMFSGNVLIRSKGKLLFKKSYGLDSKKNPNADTTRFGLASSGKMFTAISILQLKEKGLLSLSDQVKRFLPELKNSQVRELTIAQLLTHSSGMDDYFEDPEYKENTTDLNDPETRKLFIEKSKLDFPPGKGWRYSNTGFLLLGDIIEKASKLPFRQYVRENIFDKLGMKASVAGNGPGGGRSTTDDISAFLDGLKHEKLLNAADTKNFLEYTVNGQYGYGTEHNQLSIEHIVGHSGGFIDQCVELNLYPKTDQMVIILSNSNPPFGHFLANRIKELLLRK
jgi:D-alanyl-D-alanine carboxypeptidase